MRADARTTWMPAHPTDVQATLWSFRRGAADPAFRITPDGAVWRASMMPSGPATMRIAPTTIGAVRVDAWGDGARDAVERAPALLGAHDDPAGFEPRHDGIAAALRALPGIRIPWSGRAIEALVPSIIEQKVTSHEAFSSWRVLVQRFGTPAPGPAPAGLTVPPSARQWTRIPSWTWHQAGVTGQRSDAIMRVLRLERHLEAAVTPGRAAVDAAADFHRIAQSVPGIGAWTSAEAAQRAVGDADAVSIGDAHLKHLVGYALEGRDMTDQQMVEALEPWRGHRYRVVRLIEQAPFPRPGRHGPRLPIAAHRSR